MFGLVRHFIDHVARQRQRVGRPTAARSSTVSNRPRSDGLSRTSRAIPFGVASAQTTRRPAADRRHDLIEHGGALARMRAAQRQLHDVGDVPDHPASLAPVRRRPGGCGLRAGRCRFDRPADRRRSPRTRSSRPARSAAPTAAGTTFCRPAVRRQTSNDRGWILAERRLRRARMPCPSRPARPGIQRRARSFQKRPTAFNVA